MPETRKIAAILAADVAEYSRLARADEDRTLARLRALRSDLIDPIIALHHGRVVKRTDDGILIEFRSVVDAARCAIEVQNGLIERNAGVAPDKRIEFRIGIHLGDVVEESDGDLMGDGVNIAAPGAICLSEDADTAETSAMRDDMRRVNAWLERASITFVDDGVEPVDVADQTLRRLFVIHKGDPLGQRFDLSGRPFGGFWQPPLFPCSHSARSPRVSCSNAD